MTASKKLIFPVILCGGAGTRLWPLSRAAFGKTFMNLAGPDSLLQQTLARVADPSRFAAPTIICNVEHRFLVAEQLRTKGIIAGDLMLETEGRNTAPAISVAALRCLDIDPDALILVLPSDHFIADAKAFAAATARAADAAAKGWLMTFGIAPDRPETGYGYIRQAGPLDGLPDCFKVERFVEKPDRATAEGYLADGQHAWNSGIFLFPARKLLDELARLEPEMVKACRQALEKARRDQDFLHLDAEAFGKARKVSIDYALMEKTDSAGVVPTRLGWTDIGSWDALWHIGERDENGNIRVGDVQTTDTRRSYLRSETGLLATIGVEDMVVIVTRDAVLVCPRQRAQDVGSIVEALTAAGRLEPLHHRQVRRPWGSFESIDAGDGFQVKRLILHPGASISLQRHSHRAEHWVVVQGTAEVTRDDDVFTLATNESTFIPLGAIHRLRNPGDTPLHIIEVQSGSYLGEDDIERFEDVYGRN